MFCRSFASMLLKIGRFFNSSMFFTPIVFTNVSNSSSDKLFINSIVLFKISAFLQSSSVKIFSPHFGQGLLRYSL